jgi:hypothetical protein
MSGPVTGAGGSEVPGGQPKIVSMCTKREEKRREELTVGGATG